MGQAFHTDGQHRGRREFARRFAGVRVFASPRGVLMALKRFASVFCVVVLSTAGAWAGDKIDSLVASTSSVLAVPYSNSLPSSTGVVEIEPLIHARMNDGLRESVETAFEIAAQRAKDVGSCAELFSEFEVGAVETLGSAFYVPVLSYRDVKEYCDRNLAFTTVGARVTYICPDFEGLSDQDAAKVIIHEALHSAGLEESPQYRRAKTSREIDSMVVKNCRF